ALRAKAAQPPHVLVMTATPIPRTVAMTVYGDLEISTLSQLPGGRSPIASHVVPAAEKPTYLDRAWQRLREEVAAGHQAYVVCPRIGDGASAEDTEPSEEERRAPLSVLEVAPLLAEGPLSGLRIGVLHGRLPADGFRLAELDLEQRREGDVLGATQSGRRSHLRLLSLLRDRELIGAARTEAITLVEADPELAGHPALRDWIGTLVDEDRAEYLEKG